jgi:hypothetical protein
MYDLDGDYIGGSILEYCIVEYAGGASVSNNGAVRINKAHPFINYCTIRNNSATGINAKELAGNLKITNSTICNNTSSTYGGGIYLDGQTATIFNNLISNNTAAYGGGGICVSDNYSTPATAAITQNAIYGNTSYTGGAIHIESGPVTISQNNIINNIATDGYNGYGGGIRVQNGWANISNNIIASNSSIGSEGAISLNSNAVISHNSIIGNKAKENAAMNFVFTVEFTYNLTTNNLATGTAPSCAILNGTWALAYATLNYNNIFNNNSSYELMNNNPQDSADVNAENNWWGTDIASDVENKIYHWIDDSSKGLVDYYPFDSEIRTDAPISPPTGLAVSTTDTTITMSWVANPEADVAGYKVYWGTQPSPFFENVVNVGNSLGHTITGLAPGTYYVGVTAYDNNYNLANDDPGTIINENQTNGNESWYATTIVVVGTPEPRILTLLAPNGGETLLAGNIFTINWQSEGLITDVIIEYSTNNGSDWTTIATVSNTGTYEWPVPAVTSQECLIAITDTSNSAISDTSDDVFTIIKCSRLIPGDLNKDCYVDFYDFAVFAEDWLKCSNPLDPDCMP